MINNIYNQNLNDQDFKLSYWVATNRLYLRTIGVLLLGVVSGGLLLVGAGGLFKYFVLDKDKNLALEQSIGTNRLNESLLSEVGRPQDLQVQQVKVFQTTDSSADFFAEVVNPNEQWAVESFDYYFEYGGEKTMVKTDFILPDSTKYVLHLNFPANKKVGTADLKAENIKWKKVPEYKNLFEKFNQFDFQNITTLSSNSSGVSDKERISTVNFDILNKSAYSYWEPKFIVLMFQRDSLVGVSQVVLSDLKTGEKRTESFNLFQELADSVDVKIIPDINILDPNVFKSFDNTSGELK